MGTQPGGGKSQEVNLRPLNTTDGKTSLIAPEMALEKERLASQKKGGRKCE